MKRIPAGTLLIMRTRHQDVRQFRAEESIAEVMQGTETNPDKIKIRVFLPSYRPKKGYLAEIIRVSDSIWLERIGKRLNADGSTNLPCVHEIVGELTEEEFTDRRTALTNQAETN